MEQKKTARLMLHLLLPVAPFRRLSPALALPLQARKPLVVLQIVSSVNDGAAIACYDPHLLGNARTLTATEVASWTLWTWMNQHRLLPKVLHLPRQPVTGQLNHGRQRHGGHDYLHVPALRCCRMVCSVTEMSAGLTVMGSLQSIHQRLIVCLLNR
jgi:hypothetical protein